MNSKVLIDLLIKEGAELQDITDALHVSQMLLTRTNQYEEILSLVEKIELNEMPKLKEFISLLHAAGMLTSSGVLGLVRECMGRSDALIVYTADTNLISLSEPNTLIESTKTGLEVHQGQRVYKRLLDSDVSKLLQ